MRFVSILSLAFVIKLRVFVDRIKAYALFEALFPFYTHGMFSLTDEDALVAKLRLKFYLKIYIQKLIMSLAKNRNYIESW